MRSVTINMPKLEQNRKIRLVFFFIIWIALGVIGLDKILDDIVIFNPEFTEYFFELILGLTILVFGAIKTYDADPNRERSYGRLDNVYFERTFFGFLAFAGLIIACSSLISLFS